MQSPSAQVFLGLGSNLGDRLATLDAGLRALEALGFRTRALSSRYETEPVGGPAQGWYVNAVVRGETELPPRQLLEACLHVERQLGRERRVRWEARTLDLDLLLYGDLVLDEPGLRVPHPRLCERRFVLEPLAELAPELRHPLLGLRVAELLERCPDVSAVRRLAAAGARG
jgi:2-amino-4-hydroxy-6-hydroxymethyldihydropteridine diphosphokinase